MEKQRAHAKKPKRKKRAQEPRKPFGLLYVLACFCSSICFRLFYRLKTENSAIKGIKGPVLVLCNHQSNLDFLIMALTVYPLRLNMMVTTYFYHSRVLRFLLTILGTIPKKQFVPDPGAIKSVLKVIGRGGNIGIFPEGQVCYSGMNCDIDASIGKLIKKLGVTTINVAIRGNHLTCPKWAKGQAAYRGGVRCSASILFTKEQIQALSADEITAQTVQALAYNEYEWQRGERIDYKPRLRKTDGLDMVLHHCPSCGADFAMRADKDILYCEHCGYRVRLTNYGFFEPCGEQPLFYDNPAAWYTAQRDTIIEKLQTGRLLPIASPCALYKTMEGKHGYTRCGAGTMTLDDTGLSFEGTSDGAPLRFKTPYEHQTHMPHSAVYCAIDVHGNEQNYALAPTEGRLMLHIVESYAQARKQFMG